MKKTKIIAIVGIIASIVIIIAMVSVNARPYVRVSQVTSNPSAYDNREIQVIGIVQGYSGGDFNLADSTNLAESIIIDISLLDSIPIELENGFEIVITGIFNSGTLIASQILVQCST